MKPLPQRLAVASVLVLTCVSCGGARNDRAGDAPLAESGGAGPVVATPFDTPEDSPAAGKWRQARTRPAPAAAAADRSADEALLALPYLQGYRPARATEEGSVVVYRPGAAADGLNLYTSGHGPEAILMDMDGRVLHRWRYPLERFRPELFAVPEEALQIQRLEYFRRARLLPDGSLLAIFEGLGLIKLDERSRLLWAYVGGAHHDLDVAPDGRIFVLDRESKLLPRLDPERPVLEDFVTVLSAEGEVLDRVSVLEAFERSAHSDLLARMPAASDILHTNTLEILDGRLAGRDPAFRRGNLLISVLELDTVAVIDPVERKVVWALSDLWRKQHQPTILANGHMLVFDNLGPRRDAGLERSRVVELDPFTREVAWSYGGDRETDFFSKTLGSSARLANGNTLITESENGRAFEVTPAGEVVWDFWSPHRAGAAGELVATLFEVERLPRALWDPMAISAPRRDRIDRS